MFRRQSEMKAETVTNCHEGTGRLLGRTVLAKGDSDLGIRFMHDDLLEPGATIGEHHHDDRRGLLRGRWLRHDDSRRPAV